MGLKQTRQQSTEQQRQQLPFASSEAERRRERRLQERGRLRAEEAERIAAIRPLLEPFIFEEGPENVIEEIARHLDDASLARFSRTCKRIHAICARVSAARPLFRVLAVDPAMGDWIADQIALDETFHLTKTVLLGQDAVGKSSMVLRLVRNVWDRSLITPTIGAALVRHPVSVLGSTITLELWDTAGQERYHAIAPMYYRGAAVAVVMCHVCKLDNNGSKEIDVARIWIQEFREFEPTKPILLLGTMPDLGTGLLANAQALAEEFHLPFAVACAKTGEGVREAFQLAALLAMKRRFSDDSAKKSR